MLKAVILDVDDTLSMTEAICFEIENEALHRMGRPPMSRESHIANWGQPLLDAILERSPGIDAAIFAATLKPIIQQYDADGRFLAIPETTYEALDSLQAAGRRIMLLSSRTETEMAGLLAPQHPISGRLSAAYFRENSDFMKPDPRVFDKLFTDHDLTATDCVYVGDSLTDAQAANGAGVRCIVSLESGLRPQAAFDGLQVDAFILSLAELPEAVRKLD